MKHFLLSALFLLTSLAALTAAPAFTPESIAILYNSDVPESKDLAEYYASKRNIPATQLIGLPMPDKDEITRLEYDTLVREPLRELFSEKGWWALKPTRDNLQIAVSNKIKVIVTVRGVPFGVKRAKGNPEENNNKNKLMKSNEAALDSELAALGIIGASIDGPLTNKYYKSTSRFPETKLPFTMLVGRIDGPSYKLCKQVIDDTIEAEKTGLWGMCYIDYARKGKGYEAGDIWLKKIENENWSVGIPTTVDNNKQTFLTNYPMRDTALYYGWYTQNANGAFLDPSFRFKKGAIATHIHSFSASKIRHPKSRWVGPLLEKGAVGVTGNVYEPYLSLSANLDIFHSRLLKGFTLAEAAYAASPALSWQGIVIGDPLYTPFAHLDGSGKVAEEDKLYRAVNLAWRKWGTDPEQLIVKLRSAAAKKQEPRLYEICGLWYQHLTNMQTAAAFFNSADKAYLSARDEIRIVLHLADMYRSIGKKDKALALLRDTLQANADEPAAESLKSLITILDPPAPDPAKPRKQ